MTFFSNFYTFHTLLVIYKILHNKINSKIKFTLNNELPKYSQRRPVKTFLISKTRTKYGQRTLVFEGAQLYNKLPDALKNCKSLNLFKNELRKLVLHSF